MPGRIRTIKPEWLDDQRIAHASSDARVMSIGLILLADDYGNGRCVPLDIGNRIFPVSGISLESLLNVSRRSHSALCELTEIRYVAMYEIDGQTYFSIRNWSKHQKVNHPGKPLVPGPPGDIWDRPLEELMRLARDPQDSLLNVSCLTTTTTTTNDHDLRASGTPGEKTSKKKADGESAKPEQPSSKHHQLVAHYVAEFERTRNVKPVFSGKDATAVKRLLQWAKDDIEKAKTIVTNALSDKFSGPRQTIWTIANDPNKFATSREQAEQATKASSPQGRYASDLGLPGF